MRALCAIVLGIVALASAQPAIAQKNAVNIAGCSELKAKEVRSQTNACKAHPGCVMVLNLQKSCTDAEAFLTRLTALRANAPTITNFDVFEASMPALPDHAALRNESMKAREAARVAASEANFRKIRGKTASRHDYWYEGQMDGKVWSGAGVLINASGVLIRGQFRNNGANGQIELRSLDYGEVFAGQYNDTLNGPNGFGVIKKSSGNIWEGTFYSGKLNGLVVQTFLDGSTQKQEYANGVQGKVGPKALKGEVAMSPAEIERQLAAKAAAEKAVADAAAAAEKERQEQAFQASLKNMNAGQIFTKADELDRAGEAEKARAASTALINRFPNSPLAATAAQQMGGGVSSAGGPAIGAAARPSPVRQTSSGSTDPTAGYAAMRNACAGPIATTKSEFRSRFGIELTDQDVGRTIFMMWGHRLSSSTGERQIEATLAQQRSASAGGRDSPYALANAEMSRCFHREAMRFANAGVASSTSAASAATSGPASSLSTARTSESNVPAGWSTPPTGGANCRDAIQRNTDAINRAPQPADQVRRYQYILAIAADRLAILEQYCRADSVAYADRIPVKKLFDDTMLTCTQDRGNQGECRPVRSW